MERRIFGEIPFHLIFGEIQFFMVLRDPHDDDSKDEDEYDNFSTDDYGSARRESPRRASLSTPETKFALVLSMACPPMKNVSAVTDDDDDDDDNGGADDVPGEPACPHRRQSLPRCSAWLAPL